MPVQHIGRDDDHGAALDADAGERIGPARGAADSGDGRIEPVRFLDDRAGLGQAVGEAVGAAGERAVGFGCQSRSHHCGDCDNR